MNVVLYGATGRIGSRLLTELLNRRHHVVAVTRNTDRLAPNAGLTVESGDLDSPRAIAERVEGAAAVISAYGPPANAPGQVVSVTRHLIKAVRVVSERAASPLYVPRLLVVGGAGSLVGPDQTRIVDASDFPAEWKGIALAHAEALELLRRSSIDWTYLSPSAVIEPGERTGKFRLGQDQLLVDSNGKSWISMEDYAIAMVDELEHPQHRRMRFTVGY